MYAPVVIGWLTIRVEPHAVDDLFQDVWTVFYGRWRAWQQPAELDTPEARPVLATKAHRRAWRVHEPIEKHHLTDEGTMPQRLVEMLTLGQCLEFAKTHCGEVDVAILTGKLAGISARPLPEVLRAVMLVVVVLAPGVLLITYVPVLTTMLPRWFGR